MKRDRRKKEIVSPRLYELLSFQGRTESFCSAFFVDYTLLQVRQLKNLCDLKTILRYQTKKPPSVSGAQRVPPAGSSQARFRSQKMDTCSTHH